MNASTQPHTFPQLSNLANATVLKTTRDFRCKQRSLFPCFNHEARYFPSPIHRENNRTYQSPFFVPRFPFSVFYFIRQSVCPLSLTSVRFLCFFFQTMPKYSTSAHLRVLINQSSSTSYIFFGLRPAWLSVPFPLDVAAQRAWHHCSSDQLFILRKRKKKKKKKKKR